MSLSKKYWPMLATLIKKPFDDARFVFENKWDGMRVIAVLKNGEAKLYSRSGQLVTDKFMSISDALEETKHDVVLDGELVALDNKGISRFQLLQNIGRKKVKLCYFVFDLLELDGEDFRNLPLSERKRKLKEVLTTGKAVQYSEDRPQYGVKYLKEAKRSGEEGIIAKLSDSPYESGKRSRSWLKIKTGHQQEVVIVGFTKPHGQRKHFGALLAAVFEDDHFVYVGRIGTGYDADILASLHKKMQSLMVKTAPVLVERSESKEVTWIRPELVAEVRFAEWTKAGLMRQPVYLGLRDDKKPEEVKREV